MSTRNQTNNPSPKKDNKKTSDGNQFVEARVIDCIRDSDHPYYTGPDSLGTIFYDKVSFRNADKRNLDRLNRAKPLFTFIKRYPIKNEIVLILNTTGRNIYRKTKGDGSFVKTYYLCEVNVWNSSHHNALPASEDLSSSPNNTGEAAVGIQQNTTPPNTRTVRGGAIGPTKTIDSKLTQGNTGTRRKPIYQYTYTITLESLTTGDQATGTAQSPNSELAKKMARSNAENQLAPIISQEAITEEDKLTGDFIENADSSELVAFDHTVIQDRQGAAIRLGSSTANGKNNWSNNESEGEPIVIISNGNTKSDLRKAAVESINNLNTAVVQLSNQNIDNLTVSSTNVDSLGVTYEPPSGENVIIENIPTPPIELPEVVTNEELEETIQSTDDSNVVEEAVQKESPPEISEVGIYDDPIFALLDEAQDEGEITFIETSYDVAGTDATEGDEDDFGDIIPDNNSANSNFPENNDAAVTLPEARAAINRQPVILINKSGQQHITPPPDPGLTMSRTTRKIRYIFVHTSAGNQSRIPSDTQNFFFKPNISRDGVKGGDESKGGDGKYYGRFWNKGGYHWMIEKTGGLATRLYPDSEITNGAGKAHTNRDPNHINPVTGEIEPLRSPWNDISIHLNWMGGINVGDPLKSCNITQEQTYTLVRLIRKYLDLYPESQVIGHNQVKRKECPWFSVPQFAKNIDIPDARINTTLPIMHDESSDNTKKFTIETAIQNSNRISNGI